MEKKATTNEKIKYYCHKCAELITPIPYNASHTVDGTHTGTYCPICRASDAWIDEID